MFQWIGEIAETLAIVKQLQLEVGKLADKQELDAAIESVKTALDEEKKQLADLLVKQSEAVASLQQKIADLEAQLGTPVDFAAEVAALNDVKAGIEGLVVPEA